MCSTRRNRFRLPAQALLCVSCQAPAGGVISFRVTRDHNAQGDRLSARSWKWTCGPCGTVNLAKSLHVKTADGRSAPAVFTVSEFVSRRLARFLRDHTSAPSTFGAYAPVAVPVAVPVAIPAVTSGDFFRPMGVPK